MSEHFFCSSLSNIKSSDWNECVGNDHPFLQYEFLYALEKSNSACDGSDAFVNLNGINYSEFNIDISVMFEICL